MMGFVVVLISWGCPVHVKLDPQRAELHLLAEGSYGLWHKALSSAKAFCYLGQYREHPKKRTKDLKTLSIFPTKASVERHRKLPTQQQR